MMRKYLYYKYIYLRKNTVQNAVQKFHKKKILEEKKVLEVKVFQNYKKN